MNLVIKQRASLVEAVMAFFLLMTNYQEKGYLSRAITRTNLQTLRNRFRDYMRKAKLFIKDPSQGLLVVAKKNGVVVGTVCAEFNPTHTPIEEVFPDELRELRNSAQSFVYLGSFAVASSYQCTRLSLRMLRDLWSLVKEKGIDIGICVVHPDHSTFYERFGFTVIALSTATPGLRSAPAALLVIKRHAVRL